MLHVTGWKSWGDCVEALSEKGRCLRWLVCCCMQEAGIFCGTYETHLYFTIKFASFEFLWNTWNGTRGRKDESSLCLRRYGHLVRPSRLVPTNQCRENEKGGRAGTYLDPWNLKMPDTWRLLDHFRLWSSSRYTIRETDNNIHLTNSPPCLSQELYTDRYALPPFKSKFRVLLPPYRLVKANSVSPARYCFQFLATVSIILYSKGAWETNCP